MKKSIKLDYNYQNLHKFKVLHPSRYIITRKYDKIIIFLKKKFYSKKQAYRYAIGL